MTDDELLARVMRRIIRRGRRVDLFADLAPRDINIDGSTPITPTEHEALVRAGAIWMTE